MALLDKLRRIAAPAEAAPAADVTTELPGRSVEGTDGGYWLRRSEFDLAFLHGGVRLGEIPSSCAASLAGVARDPRLEAVDFRKALFFDTETTSLGGGAGTYVFLLGAGYFEEGAFVVEQYFLRDVTEERALLDAINRRFASFDCIVSFHGKGFDTPRLLDRLSFHRMRPALPAAHLDLCQVGRSLYRGAFADCRLQTFERELVRFQRRDDLPGELCPTAFFRHLRGDSTLIPRVFEHNLYDILTLPAVAACFAAELAAAHHPVVLSNLGALHEARGEDREARASYLTALTGLRASRHPQLPRALERLALLERRAGRHAASAELLLERKDLPPFTLAPLEDLAKYYEHRARDLPRAEEATVEARSNLVRGWITLAPLERKRCLAALDHRLARLARRRGRDSLSSP